MKNTTKTLAVVTVLAVAMAGIALTASNSQNPTASTAIRKQPLVDEIIPPAACMAFNWGISNKVIRPKRIFASQSQTFAPTAG